jgi:hypothetical protein
MRCALSLEAGIELAMRSLRAWDFIFVRTTLLLSCLLVSGLGVVKAYVMLLGRWRVWKFAVDGHGGELAGV